MAVIAEIADFQAEMSEWRRTLHRHPETAFEEFWTADFIAAKLEEFGLEIHRGLAGTGIVATVPGRQTGNRAIGVRADMDALDIFELNDFEHRSRNDGKMHACGHDGHSTMLLGAAKYLSRTRDFSGTAYLIFQPAEENEGGAGVMVEQGLFEKFPMDAVYGMHNRPGLPVGRMYMRSGPAMAGFDIFELTIDGHGCHAANPHNGVDPIVVQAHLVTALQTIASRNINPIDSAVVSVTQVHGGDAYNVIPQQVVLRGTVRCFKADVQDMVEAGIRRIAENIGATFGADIAVHYERRYPPLINDGEHMRQCYEAAAKVFGADNVSTDAPANMASEDFAFMLNARTGCYVNIGNGEGEEGGCVVHNPHYDFNDAALSYGASYWARLIEHCLPVSA